VYMPTRVGARARNGTRRRAPLESEQSGSAVALGQSHGAQRY